MSVVLNYSFSAVAWISFYVKCWYQFIPVSKKEWLAGAVKLYAGSIKNIGKMLWAASFNKLVLNDLYLH